MTAVLLTGLGTFVPPGIKRNEDFDLEAGGIDGEWLRESGLHERRWAEPTDTIIDLALPAARRALEQARLAPGDVDLLILVSSTFRPDPIVPTGAVELKDRLGMRRCLCLFVAETCCGALMAMELACGHLRAGTARNALVVAAETFSKTFNPASGVTFRIGFAMGDGAGAVVLSARPDGEEGHLASYFDSSASFLSGLGMKPDHLPGGDGERAARLLFGFGAAPPSLDGRFLPPGGTLDAIRRFTTTTVPVAARGVLARAGLTSDGVDLFILHQPNRRFLEAWRSELAIPESRTLDTLGRFGNLSSVSVLVNADMACQTGRLRPGQTVLLASVGEGANWGAMLWRWSLPPDAGRDYLLREPGRSLRQRLVTIENLPLTEIYARYVFAHGRTGAVQDLSPVWTVVEGVPLEAAFEYLRSTEAMSEWTISTRRLRRLQGEVWAGDDVATPTGQVFVETVADARAWTIEWRLSHSDPADLWIRHKVLLVDAQAAIGRPGTVLIRLGFVHERTRRDPALLNTLRSLGGTQTVELSNLRMILEHRFAHTGGP